MTSIWGGHKQGVRVNCVSKRMEARSSMGHLRDKQKFDVAGTYHVQGGKEK